MRTPWRRGGSSVMHSRGRRGRDAGRRERAGCLAEELVSAARPVEVHAVTVEQLVTSTNGDDCFQRAPLDLGPLRIDRQRAEGEANAAGIRTPPGLRR